MIASQYGYTIDEFSSMTRREVIECCARIIRRVRDESIFHARLHGAKMDASHTQENREELDLSKSERDKAIDLVKKEINSLKK